MLAKEKWNDVGEVKKIIEKDGVYKMMRRNINRKFNFFKKK